MKNKLLSTMHWTTDLQSLRPIASAGSPLSKICMLLNNNGVSGSITISNNPSQCSSLSEVQTVCLALPIDFSKPLVAKNNLNTIILNWSVANQINNDKYIIEQSTDGRNFSSIGEIDGGGTSNETKH